MPEVSLGQEGAVVVSASPSGQRPATLSVILEAVLGARTRLKCEPQAACRGT